MGKTGKAKDNLLWIDLEMTGLDPQQDQILEVALLVTSSDLEIVAKAPSWVLGCDAEVLERMDKWNSSTHARSGLLDEVRNSRLTAAECERQALAFVRKHVGVRESPMCGNTICQDRRFLARLMPELHDYFHYRNLDVTSFKIACQRWLEGGGPSLAKPETEHRALQDIEQSVEEMKIYRRMLF
ncbi:MAG: oligoribonuclease [Betaproteobacteria bacterium AqS2]|uniref:Oligoribonuclease n=1 Tax=Candidatus Amphirhobacter heronislandensis TaxID=1732024 RepID=A0A930UI09_9GAMM|nr:oligoribonuclease [Betaproteobacteria bacterium AqS2]